MAIDEAIRDFDVVIIGGGPGGCSTALTLAKAGLTVAIIDKATFPRDKVCGELLHRKAVRVLSKLDPDIEAEFKKFPSTIVMKATRVHYKGKSILFDWVNESYTCPRYELDNFLLTWVKERTATQVFTGVVPDKITVGADGVTITIKGSGEVFSAKLIIGADGANSTVARQLTSRVLDRNHYLGAVRAYYSGIRDINEEVTEVFFNKKFKVNYFWIFPLKGGKANVGFGMLSSKISEEKINLKDAFYDYFKESPELAAKFEGAIAEGPLEGFGVPLGSGVGTLSGQRFMLIGDAASLSNPLSGTGMGNAILSGKLAGEQAIRCFQKNDFSEACMKEYDTILDRAIIKELMASFKAQRTLGKMPFLLDVVFALGKYPRIKRWLQKVV